jgi:hypothetical protein
MLKVAAVAAQVELQQILQDFQIFPVIVGILIVLLKVIHIQTGRHRLVVAEAAVVQTPTVIILQQVLAVQVVCLQMFATVVLSFV